MKCRICGGLLGPDDSLDFPMDLKCIICGRTFMKVNLSTDMECGKNTCNDRKAGNSVFCPPHRDQLRACNETQKRKRQEKVKDILDPSVGRSGLKSGPVSPCDHDVIEHHDDVIFTINRAIEFHQEAIDKLVNAKESMAMDS